MQKDGLNVATVPCDGACVRACVRACICVSMLCACVCVSTLSDGALRLNT